jgi:hypothetical protein
MCAMRRWGWMAAATIVAACGGGTSPTTPSPSADQPLHLTPGAYTLTLDLGCAGSNSLLRASLPVSLQRADSGLTVEPLTDGASLRLRLQVSGDDRLISGTMFGMAISDEGLPVAVFGDTAMDPALVSGRADTMSVQGTILGQVRLGGATCPSAEPNWKLTPRPSGKPT